MHVEFNEKCTFNPENAISRNDDDGKEVARMMLLLENHQRSMRMWKNKLV